jgi:hypothetical protein
MEDCCLLLSPDDEVAVEATGNSAWFVRQIESYVARTVVIAPWQFEVIRRSVKKTEIFHTITLNRQCSNCFISICLSDTVGKAISV